MPACIRDNSPDINASSLDTGSMTDHQQRLVERGGFEPPKAEPADLQSAPFDRFGTSPIPDRSTMTEMSADTTPLAQLPGSESRDARVTQPLNANFGMPQSPPLHFFVAAISLGHRYLFVAVFTSARSPDRVVVAIRSPIYIVSVCPTGRSLPSDCSLESGAGDGTRTRNLLITNQLLCQLSYASQ